MKAEIGGLIRRTHDTKNGVTKGRLYEIIAADSNGDRVSYLDDYGHPDWTYLSLRFFELVAEERVNSIPEVGDHLVWQKGDGGMYDNDQPYEIVKVGKNWVNVLDKDGREQLTPFDYEGSDNWALQKRKVPSIKEKFVPREEHELKRLHALTDVIIESIQNDEMVPPHWIAEFNEITERRSGK